MAYELKWHTPNKALLLILRGEYTAEDAKAVNEEMLKTLETIQTSIYVLIDATKMERPYNFSTIRAEQTYIAHPRLKHFHIATQDRLVRLGMMVIFNQSLAELQVWDSVEQANRSLQSQLVSYH